MRLWYKNYLHMLDDTPGNKFMTLRIILARNKVESLLER